MCLTTAWRVVGGAPKGQSRCTSGPRAQPFPSSRRLSRCLLSTSGSGSPRRSVRRGRCHRRSRLKQAKTPLNPPLCKGGSAPPQSPLFQGGSCAERLASRGPSAGTHPTPRSGVDLCAGLTRVAPGDGTRAAPDRRRGLSPADLLWSMPVSGCSPDVPSVGIPLILPTLDCSQRSRRGSTGSDRGAVGEDADRATDHQQQSHDSQAPLRNGWN